MADFSLLDLKGETQSIGRYRGDQGVLLVYWAGWCSTCREELPLLNSFYDPDGPFQVLAVNYRESADTVAGFGSEHGLEFPLVLDTHGLLRREYLISAVPMLYFIDRDGILLHVVRGEVAEGEIEQWLQIISAEEPAAFQAERLRNRMVNTFDRKLKREIIKRLSRIE